MAGIDPDASLPELVEFVNDNFDMNATAGEIPSNIPAAAAALTAVAEQTQAAIDRGNAKLYKITATPPGKPKLTAFVLVG